MASDGFKDVFQNYLLASVFILAMVSFVGIFTYDNGVSNPINESGDTGLYEFSEEIRDVNADAEGWKDNFLSDNLAVSLGALVLFSLWGVIKLVFGSILGLAGLILQTGQGVLGIPPVVSGTIITALVVSLIFYGWRVIKTGRW